MDSEEQEARRLDKNRRERERVDTMNDMYRQLLSFLPQSAGYTPRMTRLDILSEATSYIERLRNYVNSPNVEGINAQQLFPHAFNSDYDNHLTVATRVIVPAATVGEPTNIAVQPTNTRPTHRDAQPTTSAVQPTHTVVHSTNSATQPTHTVYQPTTSPANQPTDGVVQLNPRV